MKYIFSLSWCLICYAGANSLAQTQITGQVQDTKGNPIPFANVYLEEIYDGATSDEQGQFNFKTQAKGEQVLIISFTGYLAQTRPLILEGQPIKMVIQLEENAAKLAPVVISAGSFEASDEKKMTILKPLDIVSVAGASADVYGALRTLPGVSQVGDETGIFVRGGEARETQTIINGTLVPSPFFGEVPDLPSRGRFDPFLFKGTLFSTGGYSAEYGQALSSVLLLNTQDIPEESSSSIGLNLAGMDVNHTQLFGENTALIAGVGYTNLGLLFNLLPQNADWVQAPQGWGANLAFRHQTAQNGIFKTYAQYQNGQIATRYPSLNGPESSQVFENQNENIYVNNSYQGALGKKWLLFAALSYSRDEDQIEVEGDQINQKESLLQNKITLGRDFGEAVYLKFGGEFHSFQGDYGFNQFEQSIDELYSAVYSEAEISLSRQLAARVGARGEYSQVLGKYNLAPRTSLAYKTGANSQVALAYGWFYQKPEREFLRQSKHLDFERATHYILNYQWLTDDYTFRAEIYYKDYQNLVRNADEPEKLFDNQGYGHATGLDLFWRDKKTIKRLDYWLSYSYIQSERNYRDYPQTAQPTYITNHTLSLVARYQFISPLVRVGATYTFASGRTYENPNNPDFLDDRTPDYHNLSFNVSYITSLFRQFTVIYASVGNPLGFRQVFGYRYSDDGTARSPVLPGATTSIFAGIFVSIE